MVLARFLPVALLLASASSLTVDSTMTVKVANLDQRLAASEKTIAALRKTDTETLAWLHRLEGGVTSAHQKADDTHALAAELRMVADQATSAAVSAARAANASALASAQVAASHKNLGVDKIASSPLQGAAASAAAVALASAGAAAAGGVTQAL